MSETESVPITITEQIYAMMLADLAADETFDEAALARLQRLIEQDRLTNRNALLKAMLSLTEMYFSENY